MAHRIIGNQLNAERIEGRHKLHQRVDVAANNPLAGFHALDGRQGQSGGFRQLALVDAKSGAPGTFLSYSTSPGAEAEDGDGADSPYATALLKAAREPGLRRLVTRRVWVRIKSVRSRMLTSSGVAKKIDE